MSLQTPPDTALTSEPLDALLMLRGDLAVSLQVHHGETCYVIRDPLSSQCYQLGVAEYTLLALLDGTRSLRACWARTCQQLGGEAFDEHDVLGIACWLLEHQLAVPREGSQDAILQAARQRQRAQRVRAGANPLIVRTSFGDPSRLVRPLTAWLGWWFHPLAVGCWAAALALAGVGLFTRFGADFPSGQTLADWRAAVVPVLAPANWLWLAVLWLLLKLLHEVGHAVACQRWGGHVRDCGVVWILFAPIPYVDVTSSWQFRSPWRRMAVAAAGMYVDLFLAAAAAGVWLQAGDPHWRQHALSVMLLAGVGSLLVNGNFLMRFDGYYILSDLLRIPNLAPLASAELLGLARRLLLGIPYRSPRLSRWRLVFVRLYGCAACAWRILVCVTLALAAQYLLEGWGVVLAFLACASWLGLPLLALARYLSRQAVQGRIRWVRATAVAAGLAAVLSGLALSPWPWHPRCFAVVRFHRAESVRTAADGLVREVCVARGQRVERGQLLLKLENLPLQTELQDLQLQRRQAVLRGRGFLQAGEVAAHQAELATIAALEQKVRARREQVAALAIRAPRDGYVAAPLPLASQRGRWLPRGTEVLRIVQPDQKQLELAVSQQQVAEFREAQGELLKVYRRGGPLVTARGRLTTLEPTGTTQLASPALGAHAAGPLPVRPLPVDVSQEPSAAPIDRQTADRDRSVVLLQPHFRGEVRLPADVAARLPEGQLVEVRLPRRGRAAIASVLWRRAADWLRHTAPRTAALRH